VRATYSLLDIELLPPLAEHHQFREFLVAVAKQQTE